MNKKIKILLITSLCLNIFFIGALAGGVKHLKPRHKGSDIVRGFKQEHNEQQKTINTERMKAVEMLKSENFNQEEYNKQIDKIGSMQEEMFKEFAIDMGAKIRAMPEDERNKIIERIGRNRFEGDRPPHPRPHHNRGKEPRPPRGPEDRP